VGPRQTSFAIKLARGERYQVTPGQTITVTADQAERIVNENPGLFERFTPGRRSPGADVITTGGVFTSSGPDEQNASYAKKRTRRRRSKKAEVIPDETPTIDDAPAVDEAADEPTEETVDETVDETE